MKNSRLSQGPPIEVQDESLKSSVPELVPVQPLSAYATPSDLAWMFPAMMSMETMDTNAPELE